MFVCTPSYIFWDYCMPKIVNKTTYSLYIERLDESLSIPVRWEFDYDKDNDFFIIRYPTYNWKEIAPILNGTCLEESY